jgi:hypothetical protein
MSILYLLVIAAIPHRILLDDRVRLSRLVSIAFGCLAIDGVGYGIYTGNLLFGISGFMCFVALAVGVWRLGDWWQMRELLKKANEGMPPKLKQRGFDVIMPPQQRK